MNYQKIYDNIIHKALFENRQKGQGAYYERHHIKPRSLGGSNKKENLVLLTAREHYVCHRLLVEIYPNNKGLIFGLHSMTTMLKHKKYKRDYHITSREYEENRKNISKFMIGENNCMNTRKGVNHHNYGKKFPFSEEKKKLYSEMFKGEKNPRYGVIMSQETKDKISNALKGKYVGENNSNFGRKYSEESKRNISDSLVKLEPIACPYCDFSSRSRSNMQRYHFDNCLKNPNYRLEDHLIECPHCGLKSRGESSMKTHHFNNCKFKNKVA